MRQNALKHGLTAKTLVVLGEDAAAFRAMAEAHLAVFQPRDAVELESCNIFTSAAWRRKRCVVAEAGITNEYIRGTQLGEETAARKAALALGERLFHDGRGFWQGYRDPLAKYRPGYQYHEGPLTPVDVPAQLVAELESTLEGCRLLLECWRELERRLHSDRGWKALDMLRCIRLMGKEPLDLLDEPPGELMDMFLACHQIEGGDGGPFDELHCVVNYLEFDIVLERLQKMNYEARTPASADHARSILDNLIERYVSRLEVLFRAHQECELVRAAERAQRLMFDPGADAEKTRRYGDICVRQMTRACEDLARFRRSGFGNEEGGPEPSNGTPLEGRDQVPAPPARKSRRAGRKSDRTDPQFDEPYAYDLAPASAACEATAQVPTCASQREPDLAGQPFQADGVGLESPTHDEDVRPESPADDPGRESLSVDTPGSAVPSTSPAAPEPVACVPQPKGRADTGRLNALLLLLWACCFLAGGEGAQVRASRPTGELPAHAVMASGFPQFPCDDRTSSDPALAQNKPVANFAGRAGPVLGPMAAALPGNGLYPRSAARDARPTATFRLRGKARRPETPAPLRHFDSGARLGGQRRPPHCDISTPGQGSAGRDARPTATFRLRVQARRAPTPAPLRHFDSGARLGGQRRPPHCDISQLVREGSPR